MPSDNPEKLNTPGEFNDENPNPGYSSHEQVPFSYIPKAENIIPIIRMDSTESGGLPPPTSQKETSLKEQALKNTLEVFRNLFNSLKEKYPDAEIRVQETNSGAWYHLFLVNGSNLSLAISKDGFLLKLPGTDEKQYFNKDIEEIQNQVKLFCR